MTAVIATAISTIIAPDLAQAESFFLGLGELPGGGVASRLTEIGKPISEDGLTVVGFSRSASDA